MKTLINVTLPFASAAILNAACGNPRVALGFAFAVICSASWSLGGAIGRIACKHAEALYRE